MSNAEVAALWCAYMLVGFVIFLVGVRRRWDMVEDDPGMLLFCCLFLWPVMALFGALLRLIVVFSRFIAWYGQTARVDEEEAE
jgi:hypothetical protein